MNGLESPLFVLFDRESESWIYLIIMVFYIYIYMNLFIVYDSRYTLYFVTAMNYVYVYSRANCIVQVLQKSTYHYIMVDF